MKLLSLKYIAFAVLIAVSACKKDPDTDDPNHGDGTGNVRFKITHKVGTKQLILDDSTYTNANDTFTVALLKYYLSNFQLKNMNSGNWLSINNSYVLVDASDANSTSFTLSDVPEGDYTELKFLIGIDSTRNVSGAQDGALDPAKGMFWSWNMGYIFLKLEGNSPAAPSGYRYHVGGFSGTNNAIREINPSLGGDYIEVSDHDPEVHLMVDVAELFINPHTIDIGTFIKVVHMPGTAADSLADNYASMIKVDHIHNH